MLSEQLPGREVKKHSDISLCTPHFLPVPPNGPKEPKASGPWSLSDVASGMERGQPPGAPRGSTKEKSLGKGQVETTTLSNFTAVFGSTAPPPPS